MTAEELAVKLLEKYPILRPYKPPGFRDFREGVPPDWVGGVFYKLEPFVYLVHGGAYHFKVPFGSHIAAISAGHVLGHFGIRCWITLPGFEAVDIDGSEVRVRTIFYNLRFTLPKDYQL